MAKLTLCLTKHHAMNAYEGLDTQFHSCLTSAVGGLGAKLYESTALSPVRSATKKFLLLLLLIHGSWINA
jgi:hypothetical protein